MDCAPSTQSTRWVAVTQRIWRTWGLILTLTWVVSNLQCLTVLVWTNPRSTPQGIDNCFTQALSIRSTTKTQLLPVSFVFFICFHWSCLVVSLFSIWSWLVIKEWLHTWKAGSCNKGPASRCALLIYTLRKQDYSRIRLCHSSPS